MRVGILSFAHHHAEGYARHLGARPDVELAGFWDDDAERAADVSARFGLRAFPSPEALLAERPDAVVVTAENTRHAPLVIQAAEAGAHVLCEKPLATTVADGRAMVAACERAGVTLMTAFPMRFSAPAREVKRVLDSGQLGRLHGFNTTNTGECPKHIRAWFVDPARSGGGALMDHVVHLADMLRWYHDSAVVEVFARTTDILYPDVRGVETGGLVMLTFADGAFASIDSSWSKPPYYPTWGGLTMEIVGEGGFVTLDAFAQNIVVYGDAVQRPRWTFWGSDPNAGMIAEFLAAIREGRRPAVTGEDGLHATAIVEAAYRSAAEGQAVRLDA